ncbi:MAG TPA: hypothetical protein PLK03_11825 [Termitinemataceae bacterium]|nr:hypothetical protein [Termitinemataceae bacterium]
MVISLALAVLWYGVIPLMGAFLTRRSWRHFRSRFNELRCTRPLTYADVTLESQKISAMPRDFTFLGEVEALSEEDLLWVKNEELTIPVSVKRVSIYVLPQEAPLAYGGSSQEVPRKIAWSDVRSISEGTRIFVGGALVYKDGRVLFSSLPHKPLIVILYEGDERHLIYKTIQAGRHHNEYYNKFTPFLLALGAFSQLLMAFLYMGRPGYRGMVYLNLLALIGPVYPFIPPGLLFTLLYRRLWKRARQYRAFRDLARLPLFHLDKEGRGVTLYTGERYEIMSTNVAPLGLKKDPRCLWLEDPFVKNKNQWYVCGVCPPLQEKASLPAPSLPGPSQDPLIPYMVLEANPFDLIQTYKNRAFMLEMGALAFLAGGVLLNGILAGFLLFWLSK